MMHRLLLIAVCAAAVLTAADDSLVVRSDLSGMVDKYLTQIAELDWRARDEALAAIHDAAGVHARQKYIRETILNEIGGLPSARP